MLRRETEPAAEVPAFLSGHGTDVAPTAAELRQLLSVLDRLTPEQKTALDRMTFTRAITTAGVPFRLTQPGPATKYRILGATEVDGADALLIEPVNP